MLGLLHVYVEIKIESTTEINSIILNNPDKKQLGLDQQLFQNQYFIHLVENETLYKINVLKFEGKLIIH